MTREDELPEVSLRHIQDEDLPLLEGWLAIPDVFAFLDFEEPPNRHMIKLALMRRQVDVLLIEAGGEPPTPVGFFLVYTHKLRRTNVREFDLAIPARLHRRLKLAQAAVRAFERWAFDEQRLTGVWANIFPDNEACLSLIRACGWPLSEIDPGGIPFRGERRDVYYTHMTPELLAELRQRRLDSGDDR